MGFAKRSVAEIVADLRSAIHSRIVITPPAVESRALAVERRALAVENAEAGPSLLRVESRCECDNAGAESDREYIIGYAAKFGVNSLDLGKFTERIAPNAFRLVTERRGRKTALETRALFNHNADLPLAKYPGTLKLSVDDVGLRYEFPVPNTSYGRDLAANIRDGIVTGSSFSFTVPKDGEEWSMEEGRSIRTVTRVDSLIDVGPVTYPAYPDTDTAVAQRSYERFIEESESRIFCSTGKDGGVDSSCSPKDAGGGKSGSGKSGSGKSGSGKSGSGKSGSGKSGSGKSGKGRPPLPGEIGIIDEQDPNPKMIKEWWEKENKITTKKQAKDLAKSEKKVEENWQKTLALTKKLDDEWDAKLKAGGKKVGGKKAAGKKKRTMLSENVRNAMASAHAFLRKHGH